MVTKVRLIAALCALVTAVIVVCQTAAGAGVTRGVAVALRGTAAPMETPSTTIKWPVIDLTNPRPFDPCEDIPIDVYRRLGLDFTPPEPEEGLRCHIDAGNYQMAIEPIVWRTYEQSLSSDALETTINGHRAAQAWVMKPTDWNDRWWHACMITFKTSYGVIQQSMFFSQIYSTDFNDNLAPTPPAIDCLAENFMRAQQLSPYYIF
ncbi:MAG: DUF3558 domain-containing protein [Mycobacteriaceae bacterium]|nr:DUF3558 domain-containing protein [Mycobacteriaceae bacterium]